MGQQPEAATSSQKYPTPPKQEKVFKMALFAWEIDIFRGQLRNQISLDFQGLEAAVGPGGPG